MTQTLPTTHPTSGRAEEGSDTRSSSKPGSSAGLGWIVALSLATGFVAAVLFAALPFVPVKESAHHGRSLVRIRVGWAMLWLLSLRFTDQPQRWAVGTCCVHGRRRAHAGGLRLPYA